MKKYLLSVIVTMLSAFIVVQAQEQDVVIKGNKQIDKKLTPQQVVDSLNKRFPDAESVKYFTAKSTAVERGWNISEENKLPLSEDLDYYTISFNRQGLKYYGLYDREGNLLESKIEESVDSLPEAIHNAVEKIPQQYPGYKVVSKTYFKEQDYTSSKYYYEVVAESGGKKKMIYYTPDGTLIKVKDQ
jgi:hypothetical protein